MIPSPDILHKRYCGCGVRLVKKVTHDGTYLCKHCYRRRHGYYTKFGD